MLGQVVEEGGDEVRLDGEPAIGRLDEDAFAYAEGFASEELLVLEGSQVLDDTVGVDDVEALIVVRKIAPVALLIAKPIRVARGRVGRGDVQDGDL